MSSPSPVSLTLAAIAAELARAARANGQPAAAEQLERLAGGLPASDVPLPIDRLWTLEEAARYLGMSESWVRRSDVPIVLLGRARRYDPEQVKAYARARLSHHILEPPTSRRTA